MKAIVWHGIGDIRLDEVPEPTIQDSTDAIVKLTASAICGTDLHFVRGTVSPMVPGTILGHEGVGIVEQVGSDVRNLNIGDRVVIGSTIGCGMCSYCRAGYYAQCDKANPNGPEAGTCFFGGPKDTGPIQGLQAEKARIPFASVTCVKLPDSVSDDQAIPISDIWPTGYFGAAMNKNLTIRMGNCNHRKYIPHLIDLAANGTVDPTKVLTEIETMPDAIEAYKAFGQRRPGWIKVELAPAA